MEERSSFYSVVTALMISIMCCTAVQAEVGVLCSGGINRNLTLVSCDLEDAGIVYGKEVGGLGVGIAPSFTVSGKVALVVHMGAGGPMGKMGKGKSLYYRVGEVGDTGIVWGGDEAGKAHTYDKKGRYGYAAHDGETVVEVHEGKGLQYFVGKIDTEMKTVEWGKSKKYAKRGWQPSVALSGNHLVEVHKGVVGKLATAKHGLKYHVGVLNKEKRSVDWGEAYEIGPRGDDPSVATNGEAVAIVFESGLRTVGYRVGILNKGKRTIDWGEDKHFSVMAVGASIAMNDGQVLVSYEMVKDLAGTGVGLASKTGKVNLETKTIEWKDIQESEVYAGSPSICVY